MVDHVDDTVGGAASVRIGIPQTTESVHALDNPATTGPTGFRGEAFAVQGLQCSTPKAITGSGRDASLDDVVEEDVADLARLQQGLDGSGIQQTKGVIRGGKEGVGGLAIVQSVVEAAHFQQGVERAQIGIHSDRVGDGRVALPRVVDVLQVAFGLVVGVLFVHDVRIDKEFFWSVVDNSAVPSQGSLAGGNSAKEGEKGNQLKVHGHEWLGL